MLPLAGNSPGLRFGHVLGAAPNIPMLRGVGQAVPVGLGTLSLCTSSTEPSCASFPNIPVGAGTKHIHVLLGAPLLLGLLRAPAASTEVKCSGCSFSRMLSAALLTPRWHAERPTLVVPFKPLHDRVFLSSPRPVTVILFLCVAYPRCKKSSRAVVSWKGVFGVGNGEQILRNPRVSSHPSPIPRGHRTKQTGAWLPSPWPFACPPGGAGCVWDVSPCPCHQESSARTHTPLPATGKASPGIFRGQGEARTLSSPVPELSTIPALAQHGQRVPPAKSKLRLSPSKQPAGNGGSQIPSELTDPWIWWISEAKQRSSGHHSKGGVIPPAPTLPGHCKRGSCPSLCRHGPGRLPAAGCLQAEARLCGISKRQARSSPRQPQHAQLGKARAAVPGMAPEPPAATLTASFSSVSSPSAEQQDGTVPSGLGQLCPCP